MQRVREAAEKAKIELSSSTQTSINLPYITIDAEKNPLFLDETLTRAQFQNLTHDLLERTRRPFETVIKDGGVKVGRHRPDHPGRRFHPNAGSGRPRPRADRWQRAEQVGQPRRGRLGRRRSAGRCPQG